MDNKLEDETGAGSGNNQPLILALDSGTQSIRALVFDLQGQLHAKSKVELQAYVSPQPGWAEQDVDYYWHNLCQALQQLWPMIGDDKRRIAGMALTTQRATVVNLDAEGNALRPAISWLDQRRCNSLPAIGYGWDGLLKILGQGALVKHFRSQAESNWLREVQPEIWGQTDKFLLLSGFLHYRLCGEYRDCVAAQVGYIPFDYRRQHWASRWDWKWPATGIALKQLPQLVPAASQLGVISELAATQTGLPAGLPIIAAGADKACEILGSGCLSPDIGAVSYGTTATINTTSQKYIEAVSRLPAYPSSVPGSYCTEVQVFRGFWMVNWFKQQFGLPELLQSGRDGTPPELLFDQLIADIPPGSMGLMLQPYWTPGVKFPGPEAKGAIIGFGDIHTRGHIYRAILEGLAYSLREGAELIEKRTGQVIKVLRVSGGGSQSDAMLQITADVFGLRAERPHTYETSGLGAAIDAAVGLGFYPDFPSAVQQMVHRGDAFEPNPESHGLYQQLYRQVYQKMYPRLSPLYRVIRDITGYPPT
jgi:sugar (pentulose or hexulose) kinase